MPLIMTIVSIVTVILCLLHDRFWLCGDIIFHKQYRRLSEKGDDNFPPVEWRKVRGTDTHFYALWDIWDRKGANYGATGKFGNPNFTWKKVPRRTTADMEVNEINRINMNF